MPPKRAPGAGTPRRPASAEQSEPISPLPSHRWRRSVFVNGVPLPSTDPPADMGVAAASGLGFFGGLGELLVVRCGLAAAVWGTLYLDLTISKHRAWSALYTHWNLLLLAGFSSTALLSSVITLRAERSGAKTAGEDWATQLSQLVFPLVAVCHPLLDVGYFLFLHRRMAARSGWGVMAYTLGGWGPLGLSKHLLNAAWVLAEVGVGKMALPAVSIIGPFLLNCVYIVFAVQFHGRYGEWIYPPLENVFWRSLFPGAYHQ